MARIKTSNGRRYAVRDYYIARTQCGAVISPNQDYIWVGDDALDYDTLNPIFSKPCSALLPFGGDLELPNHTALISNKATALAAHNSGWDEAFKSYNGWIAFENVTYMRNLDKADRLNKGGTVFSFEDSGGNPHHLIMSNRTISSDAGSTYFSFVQGDDFSQPVNSVKGTLPTAAHPFSGISYTSLYRPLSVDPTNKVIYMLGFAFYSQGYTGCYGLLKVPFTTVPIDGALSLGSPVSVALNYIGNGRYMSSNNVFYAGKNNAGLDHFLMTVENEGYYYGTSVGSTRLPSTATKANKHRIYFYSYDATSNTVTTLADLKGTEGFVGDVNQTTDIASDHFSFYVPTHFEQSPIAGETDIYYGYQPCFDATTADMSLLMMKWDKANDTFEVTPASLTFNGADAIQDFITYAQYDNLNNINNRLNCVLTKDGSNYYVTVFYSHNTVDQLAVSSAATLQTALTFSINSTDFSALTYSSHTAISVLGWASQDVNNTRLFIIEPNAATLWAFSGGAWVKSASATGACRAISQDQDARYWAVMQNTGDYDDLSADPNVLAGSTSLANYTLTLLSADLPASVSVEFADATITYAGSNLTKNLVVNAYDENGDRVAKSVRLKLTGSNAVFQSNNGTVLTTTTSATADTIVPLTISGAGFINVSASFTV